MTDQVHRSPLQFLHQRDGSITLNSFQHITLETIQEQYTVTGRDWQGELGLPKYYEDWEVMARVRDWSSRFVRFVLMDESTTRLPGNPRLQPKRIQLPQGCQLELGHTGFVVGAARLFLPVFDDARAIHQSGLPFEPEGDYIIGTARLFDSILAEKAWQGLQRGIFTHVCPIVFRTLEEPAGTGQLVQVTLTPGDYPGCPGARILKAWNCTALATVPVPLPD